MTKKWQFNDLKLKCEDIKGKTLAQILPDMDWNTYKMSNKGNFGTIIEKNIFDLDIGNKQAPDFENLGIELKCTPLKWKRNNSTSGKFLLIPKERISLTNIDYLKMVNQSSFKSSTVYEKCNKILYIFYLYEPKQKFWNFKILGYEFVTLDKSDLLDSISKDYQTIRNKVIEGYAHQLSESLTNYLGACTKGSSTTKKVSQPNSEILAKKRAFSFKSRYISTLLDSINGVNTQSAIKEIHAKTDHYINKEINELIKIFNLKNNVKSIKNDIISCMLGSKPSAFMKSFDTYKSYCKNITYTNKNALKEEVGLVNVDFSEFTNNITFDDSELFLFLNNLNMILFKWKIDGNKTFFKGISIFKIDGKIIENARYVWNHTKQLFNESNCIQTITSEGKRAYNFIKISDDRNIHVRPHDLKRINRFQMPDGQWLCKMQYWLNKSLIKDFLNATEKKVIYNKV